MSETNQEKFPSQKSFKYRKDCIVLVDRNNSTRYFPLTRKVAALLQRKGLYNIRGSKTNPYLLDNFGGKKPRVVLELLDTLQESIDCRRIGISPNSVYAYIRAIELFSINVPLPESIKAVDYECLTLYRNHIEEEAKKDIGNGSRVKTHRLYYNYLVVILQHCREGKNLPILRTPLLRLPTIELSPREPYSLYVCDQIYAAAYSDIQQIRNNFIYFQKIQTDHIADYMTNTTEFIGIMKALLEYKEELYRRRHAECPSYGDYPFITCKEYGKLKDRLSRSNYGLTPKEFAQKYDNKENETFTNSKQLITQKTSDKSLSALKFYCQRFLPSFFIVSGEDNWNAFQAYSFRAGASVFKDIAANPDVAPLSSKSLDSILELFVPTIHTIIPFFILAHHTGANPESIRSMRRVHRIGKKYIPWNDERFKRGGGKLMVRMKKARGQRRGDRKFFEREIGGSKKPNLVEILEFYSEYSAALAKMKPENTEVDFWLYVGERGKIKTITKKNIYGPFEKFFDRHEILDEKGNRIRNFSPSRIRPSFVLQELIDGRTPAQIRSSLGHYRKETLDHYIKNERVNKVLDLKTCDLMKENLELVKLRAKMVTGDTKADQKLIKGAVRKQYALCTDEKNPTIDNPRFDSSGKCQSHLGCFGCERAVITREILPFLCVRLLEMEDFKEAMKPTEWQISFGDDYNIGLEGLAQFSKKDQEIAWLKAQELKLEVAPLTVLGTA